MCSHKSISYSLSLLFTLFFTQQSFAFEVFVENADFESNRDDLRWPGAFVTGVPAWDNVGGRVRSYWTTQFVVSDTSHQVIGLIANGSAIRQDLGVALQAGVLYRITFDLGKAFNRHMLAYQVVLMVDSVELPLSLSTDELPNRGQFITVQAEYIADENAAELINAGNMIIEFRNTARKYSRVLVDNVNIEGIELVDFDNDGVSGEAEQNILMSDPNDAYSLDPSGLLNDGEFDSDGDNASNADEITANSDPLDPGSFPSPFAEENTVNDHFRIQGALQLTPQASAPFVCAETTRGSVYYDTALNFPIWCNGIEWLEFASEPGGQGKAGPRGLPGMQGTSGAPGLQGEQGSIGATGAQGEQGSIGATGAQGEQGTIGAAGSQGEQGTIGAAGSQGEQGPIGATGTQGEQGPIGATGAQGEQGSIGATGTQGAQGPIGATGSQGEAGENGERGAAGTKGDPGIAGSAGLQGLTGPIGFMGPQGPSGTSSWADGSGAVSTSLKVGIGVQTPEASLHVNGNVIGASPTENNHLTTKAYVDQRIAELLALLETLPPPTPEPAPTPVPTSEPTATPEPDVPSLPDVSQAVGAGDGHTCAILEDGQVKCWGNNNSGALGLGDTINRGDNANEMGGNLPAVDLGSGASAVQIVAGFHSCALLDDGQVKCWGRNDFGALGLEDQDYRGDNLNEMGRNLPSVNLGSNRTARQLSAYGFHTCALLDNGQVKCWGFNGRLQLGFEGSRQWGGAIGEMGDNLPTVNLGSGRTALQITTGNAHSCALLDNFQAKCWGLNAHGVLGIGSSARRAADDSLPTIDLGLGRTALQIETGGNHSCAILDDGDLKCWGYNSSGQLGLSDQATRGDAPNEMGNRLPFVELGTGRTAKQIALGFDYTCALLDNDQVKCWGNNLNGQLGYGDTLNRGDNPNEMGNNLATIDFGTGRTVQEITIGTGQACVLLDNDDIKCWGAGGTGQLGSGDTLNRGGNASDMGDNLPALEL